MLTGLVQDTILLQFDTVRRFRLLSAIAIQIVRGNRIEMCPTICAITPQKLEQRNDRYYETYETRPGCEASGNVTGRQVDPIHRGFMYMSHFFYETTRHKRKLVFFSFFHEVLFHRTNGLRPVIWVSIQIDTCVIMCHQVH